MNMYASLVEQDVLDFESFTLECGTILRNVPVAYKTWGCLNAEKDNVMVICHAFTGSADVEDWWGPLMGPGKAFDPTRYFIFCGNVLGSPYGTASPVTTNPDSGQPYGPEFPPTTIRDDVRLHKRVLDSLGVKSVAVVIGGSMGGMAVLEWPLCTEPGFVRHIIPIATSAQHSAWCISWGEAQRQSIFSDPLYNDGFYDPHNPPHSGLAAARMAALLTYRSRDSFESRFGRKLQAKKESGLISPPRSPGRPADEAVATHNDGYKKPSPILTPSTSAPSAKTSTSTRSSVFSAQSYLRYQGDKFTSRFDANCYIHITRKLDTHDISRGRVDGTDESLALAKILSTLPSRALVIGVQTDGLFMITEQKEIARHIPDAKLIVINSPDGHDGFLLEFEQINAHILEFLRQEFPCLYENDFTVEKGADFGIKKTSMFGEAEVDITRW